MREPLSASCSMLSRSEEGRSREHTPGTTSRARLGCEVLFLHMGALQNYVPKLLELFKVCEDLGNMEGLHDLYRIFKGLSKTPARPLIAPLAAGAEGGWQSLQQHAGNRGGVRGGLLICILSTCLFWLFLRSAVLLNDGHIMDILFSDNNIIDVIGALECK